MNKQKGLLVELERSINLQVHIMTFEEALRNAAVIGCMIREGLNYIISYSGMLIFLNNFLKIYS